MSTSLRLSTCILPVHRWHEGGQELWRRAETLGFHTGFTYDHLSWRVPFRDGTWFGAVPTLTAAAAATERLRLGTLVTSPNFRHPVTLAKELISLDDISGGRITLGIGAGGNGFDATVLGQEAWTPRERADRFGEFVAFLDRLLTEDAVSQQGDFYSADEARNIPGCVQRPRLPFAVAATGPRGLRLAARYGQAWVTTGDPKVSDGGTAGQSEAALGGQIQKLTAACEEEGREAEDLDKLLLTGFTPEGSSILDSVDRFVDFAGRHRALGFSEIVVHWPVADTHFAAGQTVFEKIATEAASQLG